MTNEDLVEKIQQGERDLLPQLWEQVERFVAKVAVRWAKAVEPDNIPEAIEFSEELIHTGYIAVVEAAEAYSPEQDVTFVHFLSFYLKKYFAPECAARAGMSTGVYHRAYTARQKKKQGQELNGQEQKMIKFCFPTSLNALVGNGGSGDKQDELGDFIPDPADDYADAEERIFQQQLHEALEAALVQLTENGEKVIRLRYYQEFSLSDIARSLGLSTERVRQIEDKALRDLRKPGVSKGLEGFVERCTQKMIQQYVEERTPYYMRIGVDDFHSGGESAVERIVFKREQIEQRALERIARLREQNQIRKGG